MKKLKEILKEIDTEILNDFDSEKTPKYQELYVKVESAINTGSTDKIFVELFRGQFEAIKIRNDNEMGK